MPADVEGKLKKKLPARHKVYTYSVHLLGKAKEKVAGMATGLHLLGLLLGTLTRLHLLLLRLLPVPLLPPACAGGRRAEGGRWAGRKGGRGATRAAVGGGAAGQAIGVVLRGR